MSKTQLKKIAVCKRKSQFLRRDTAEQYAVKMGERYGCAFKVYECPCCTAFHLATVR